jgi:tetrahydromethanopterin S-methyltransferase subunit G
MKIKTKLSIVIFLALLNHQCGDKMNLNHFSSSNDTLVIRTEKHKGNGLFTLGVLQLNFEDTAKGFVYSVTFPRHVTNIKRVQILTDIFSKEDNYVDIMSGEMNGQDVYVVDEKNNKDFSDDSIRILRPITWGINDDQVKCKFLISNGQKIVRDSSWMRIGILYGDIWGGRSEHLVADFTIDKENFKIGVVDRRVTGFSYNMGSEAALISHNEQTKDTLSLKDIIKTGEYLDLNGVYYRFENITNNGDHITLIREQDIGSKIGTQVGMMAPDFICTTVDSQTVKSSSLHDGLIIIANTCGCGGDKGSTNAYFEIRDYNKDLHVLRLDSKIERGSDGFQIDISEDSNKDIYTKFRGEYCSRTCYAIDKNNRIIDKFPIDKWESNLPKLISQN